MDNAGGAQGGPQQGTTADNTGGPAGGQQGQKTSADGEVTDVDVEEVK